LRHDFVIEGHGYRLRPVTEQDTAFILSLRTDPILGRFLHKTSSDPAAHLQWLQLYHERPGDYYFVVESRRANQPEGTISLYGIDSDENSAEWGRWVLQPGSLAAIESAALIFRFAFDQVGLDLVWSRTMVSNEKVLAFHDACGCERRRISCIEGIEFVDHELPRAKWKSVAPDLDQKAQRIALRLLS